MRLRKLVPALGIAVCLLVLALYCLVDGLGTDSTPPQIHIGEMELTVSVQASESALLQGVTATDDKDGDVTDSLVVESVVLTGSDGTVRVTYAAFDAAGNVTKAQRQLRYTDYESPRFALEQPLVLMQNRYTDLRQLIRVEDCVDGDISSRIHVDNLTGSSATVAGTYTVRLWVANSLGDIVELELPVEICDANAYNGSLELGDYLVYVPQDAEFQPESWLLRYTAGGMTTDLTGGIPEDCTLEITGTVDTGVPGVYEVCYHLTRNRENRTDIGYTKLMVVVEGE